MVGAAQSSTVLQATSRLDIRSDFGHKCSNKTREVKRTPLEGSGIRANEREKRRRDFSEQ